ncbi:ribonuclease J [Cryptobacterium curtum]|uniref:ribonuclease J n=1 Tax=Cryptobacterium curtum TaxID=84163 RepID=UPI00248ECC08|nr:ribonuclease J [Cryptobacterium curtum]
MSNNQESKSTTDSKRRAPSQSYKHAHIEHERPKLTQAEDSVKGSAKRRSSHRRQSSPSTREGAFSSRNEVSGILSPKKDPKAQLKVIPLGGLDAIGKNMTVFECGNDMILDDAGIMFPDDDHPGIDLILPDYTYVLENADKLRGIVITHGHEDHTGSLPYLMKDLDCEVPIYATKLTLGLIEGKFAEHKIKNAKLIEIKPGQRIKLGCFTCDFFSVNHSIPGAVGIFFQTPAANVLHTGDFKLDQTPIDGITTDFGALSRASEVGVDLMMSDSTNANVPAFTPSEAEVGKVLRDIIRHAKGRVIIASFASHIHRMQQICDAAVEAGRKVVVTGRSMVQNTDIARRLGYLDVCDSDIIDAYDLKGIPPEKVVVMCTGSQGEPLSALARIAAGEHKTISIEAGDTVIISATPVPGNEKAVTRVVNLLAKVGADVYDKNRARVHVSGHAGAEELKIMLSIVKPRAFMPVHGEAAHLRAHAQLGRAVGIDPDKIFILENGESLVLSGGNVREGDPVQSGIVFVDGLSVGDTSQDVLDERSALVEQGIATIACAIDRSSGSVRGSVQVQMRGITGGDDAYLAEDAATAVKRALEKVITDGSRKRRDYEKACRQALQSFMWESIKQRPMVIVNLIEL